MQSGSVQPLSPPLLIAFLVHPHAPSLLFPYWSPNPPGMLPPQGLAPSTRQAALGVRMLGSPLSSGQCHARCPPSVSFPVYTI